MMQYVLSLILLVSCIGVQAAPESTLDPVKITKISALGSYAMIHFSPEFANTQNCHPATANTLNVAVIRLDDGKNKELFNVALMAAKDNKEVVLFINGCYAAFPSIYRINIDF